MKSLFHKDLGEVSDRAFAPPAISPSARSPATRRRLTWLGATLLASLAAVCGYGGAAQAKSKATVLFSFTNLRGDGPIAGLVADSAGNLYGTTINGGADGDGVVFELSPPSAGERRWTEKVLLSFNGANGENPYGSLLADAAGNLYGTTLHGGANGDGVVFELSPPGVGKKHWTPTVLLSFDGDNGMSPFGGLVADAAGNLYGDTELGGDTGYGVAFELSPPAIPPGPWTETVLLSFSQALKLEDPTATLVLDGAGNLYGTAFGGRNRAGAVFELSPPLAGQTAWTVTTLYGFKGSQDGSGPQDLVMDGAGNLYGKTAQGGTSSNCTEGCGTVFELRPPAGGKNRWTKSLLLSFDGTNGVGGGFGGKMFMDSAGDLYGAAPSGGASNQGVIFKLIPPAEGQTTWTDKLLFSFDGTHGAGPVGPFVANGAHSLYGVTADGGAYSDGVVFSLEH